MTYIGRFAPSPTGPLHFGSLVAAVASYCDAKANQGKWLLRIENVDTTREVNGAAQAIRTCLTAHGFQWDDEVIVQSERSQIYQKYLSQLIDNKIAYPCVCTRKQIEEDHHAIGIEGYIYPRTCFLNPPNTDSAHTWRMHVGHQQLSFQDRLANTVTHDMANDIGDFILKRADGIYSYHLATAIDDALQGVTHVVRGEDLLHSTSRQLIILKALNMPAPQYMHIPVVKNADGEKLSKQTKAKALQPIEAVSNLFQAFDFLELNPPQSLKNASISAIWEWALLNWRQRYKLN